MGLFDGGDSEMEEKIKFRFAEGDFPMMKCICGKLARVAEAGEGSGLFVYVCPSCERIMVHKRSCDSCKLKECSHEAEFNNLHDEDGGPLMNFIYEKPTPFHVSYTNIWGCKTWRAR
jgi:hypothetical protein